MALVKSINRNGEILTPHIADDVFMAENATVVGDVTVGEGSSLWFNSVLRGDVNTIVIGKHKLGDYVSVGHNVTIHGADVDDYALIGMGATLLDDAHVGEGAIVAAGALVLKGTQIGPHEIWGGVPAKFIKKADPAQTAEINKKIANNYAMYASWYKE